jgi:Predicted N-acetylglucosamine kinase
MAAASEALAKAGLTIDDITRVAGGLAGANWPDEIEMLQNEMKRLFNVEHASVWNDCVVALRAGTDADNAIVICSGSGMNSAVFIDGRLHTVYNNYIELMDQGGEALGGRVFKSVFQSYMQIIEPTSLTERVMEYFGYTDMDSMLLAYQRNQLIKPLKDLSILLFEEADRNDPAALEIIYSYSKSISKYVTSAIKKYNIDTGVCIVVLSGGVFKAKNPLLHEAVCTHIHRVYSNLKIEQAKYEPVVGAALMELDKLGPKNDEAHELCKKEAERLNLVRSCSC